MEGKINTAIETLNEHRKFNDISIETFITMETGSLNLFFALLFIICMKGEGDKNMNEFKLERALTNLSLDKINDIIQALREKNASYSFVDIIDTLNKTLFDNNSRLAIEIDPSRHENPYVRRAAKLSANFDAVGGSSSKSKKNRKSHKSYHPDIGKTKKHHHSHHKKISFVH